MDIETEAMLALNRLRQKHDQVEAMTTAMQLACAEINNDFDEQDYQSICSNRGESIAEALNAVWMEIGKTNISDLRAVVSRMNEKAFGDLNNSKK